MIDESGFLLIPNVTRTWAPRGCTPRVYRLCKHHRLSAITALTVAPRRHHIGLYLHFQDRAFDGLDVRAFLSVLLRHLRGPIVILWDRGSIHRRREVTAFLWQHPRVQVEHFAARANVCELRQMLNRSYQRMRGSNTCSWPVSLRRTSPRPDEATIYCGQVFHYLYKDQYNQVALLVGEGHSIRGVNLMRVRDSLIVEMGYAKGQ